MHEIQLFYSSYYEKQLKRLLRLKIKGNRYLPYDRSVLLPTSPTYSVTSKHLPN